MFFLGLKNILGLWDLQNMYLTSVCFQFEANTVLVWTDYHSIKVLLSKLMSKTQTGTSREKQNNYSRT